MSEFAVFYQLNIGPQPQCFEKQATLHFCFHFKYYNFTNIAAAVAFGNYFEIPIAKIKKGRLLVVQKCEINWCKIKSEKFRGWITADNIWGPIN